MIPAGEVMLPVGLTGIGLLFETLPSDLLMGLLYCVSIGLYIPALFLKNRKSKNKLMGVASIPALAFIVLACLWFNPSNRPLNPFEAPLGITLLSIIPCLGLIVWGIFDMYGFTDKQDLGGV
jgi:hypothetical protein